MPLTNAQKQHRARKKKAATLARYEGALWDILLTCEDSAYASSCCQIECGPVKAVNEIHERARQALNPTTDPHAGERDE